MTTPDDYLGPEVTSELTLENGQVVELTARPHRERGFTDRTMVGIRPIRHRFGTGVSAYLLKGFAGLDETVKRAPDAAMARVLAALEVQGGKPVSQPLGTYLASCPAHGSDRPPLLVARIERGVVFTCRTGGCSTGEILAALGLTTQDLFCDETPTPAPTIGLGEVSLTVDDTKAVLDWLFGQNAESAP